MVSFIFFFFFPKKTLVRKKGNVILKLNSRFLFILYVSTFLSYRQSQLSQPLPERTVLVFLPTLTMAQHWPSEGESLGCDSCWGEGWSTISTVQIHSSHLSRKGFILSLHLSATLGLSPGLWISKIKFFIFKKNFETFWLHGGSVFYVLTSEG